MRSKTVAKSVGVHALLEAGALGGFMTRMPNGFRIDRSILAIVAGKQPGAGFAMVETPVGAECREELGTEHDIAIFAALAAADVHHHPLPVDVADFQVGQLGAPSAGGVGGHEQDALARSARCMNELRDFFLAQNRRQVACLLRIRSVGNGPRSVQCLDVEKTPSRQVLSYGIWRQLAFLEQLGLIFANVSRAQTIRGTAKSSGKFLDGTKVVAYGILSVVTTVEFFHHHFAKMGHRNTSCDPHLHPSHRATNARLRHAKRPPPGGYVQTALPVRFKYELTVISLTIFFESLFGNKAFAAAVAVKPVDELL